MTGMNNTRGGGWEKRGRVRRSSLFRSGKGFKKKREFPHPPTAASSGGGGGGGRGTPGGERGASAQHGPKTNKEDIR